MNKSIRIFMGLLVAAIMVAGVTANPAMAQDKMKAAKAEKGKPVVTVLAENDKVRAQEVRSRPGDENTGVASSSTRVVRVLKGGMTLRTYADGKTEKWEWKTGSVHIEVPSTPFKSKNVGTSDYVLYVVIIK